MKLFLLAINLHPKLNSGIMENQSFVLELLNNLLLLNFLRYFLITGPVFLIFYVLFKNKWKYKRIQLKFPKTKDYIRELVYSIITIFIFVAIAMIVFASPLKKYNQVYQDVSQHGWIWWFVSMLLMILLHDAYFYWTHRMMHHPKLFKVFHLIHHKSTNPSPWAAYSFHPLEGIVEAGIIFPLVYLIPFHPSALMIFLLFMMIYNVYGHLGYEILPKKFNTHPIGRWMNTSVTHNMHHKYFNGNYGLYFLFWDRIMGTIHPDYDDAYEEVDNKRNNR